MPQRRYFLFWSQDNIETKTAAPTLFPLIQRKIETKYGDSKDFFTYRANY